MTFSRRLLPVLLFLALFENARSQTLNPQLESALNQTLKNMRMTLGVKSLGAALQFPDDVVWSGANGVSSVVPFDTVTTDYTYALGSITKTMTAACILQLADAGLLSLNDSLSKWQLDTLPFVNPNITVRQLLRHQSGLYDVITDQQYGFDTQIKKDSAWELVDVLSTYLHAPLAQPGSGFSYCNTNYLLLGLIIKNVTGHYYHEEYRDRFINPLALSTMVLPYIDPLPTLIAHPWVDLTGDLVSDDAIDFFAQWQSFFTTAGPAGGYMSTPADVARWLKVYMSGSLLSPAIMAEAKVTVSSATLPAGTKYGLGLMERKFAGLTGFGHGGDIIYSSIGYYFPAKNISIAVMNNDSKQNSWTLAPVITALLNTYLQFENASAVHDPLAANLINSYPNPFTDHLVISLQNQAGADNIQWVLTNVMGETVAQNEILNLPEGEQEIPVNNLEQLPSGVYFLSTQVDGKQAETIKLFKTGRT